MTKAANNMCFVVAPIGDAESETRKRSDQILKHIISPAAKECGFETIRADQISEPGIITTQVIQHIIDDSMVVADLTGKNPNVFYELAIRHALRKPYIQIIERGERIPFDVAAVRTIEVDHHDLDSVEVSKSEIIKQMKSMQSIKSIVESPISIAIDLEVLRQSGNPEQRQLADVLASINDLRSALSVISTRVIDPMGLMHLSQLRGMLQQDIRSILYEFETQRHQRNIHPGLMEELQAYMNRLLSFVDDPDWKELNKCHMPRLEEVRELVHRCDRLLRSLIEQLQTQPVYRGLLEELESRFGKSKTNTGT